MKSFLVIGLMLTTLFNSNFVFADMDSKTEVMNEDGCLSESLIKEITSDFVITFDSALDAKTISACDTNDITNRLIRGLAFLKYGQFHTSKKSDDETFYNEFEAVKPYDFLKNRIKKIHLIDECDSKTWVAYVKNNEDTFQVCVKNFKERFRSYIFSADYASTALHESRHTDSDDIGHVTCNRGNEKGSPMACDKDRAQHGAYHYGTDYYAYIANFGKNFHPAIQAGTRYSALNMLMNKFNKLPDLKVNQYVILKSSENNQLFSLSDQKKIHNLGTTTSDSLYSRGDGEFSIFESAKNHFVSWNFFDNKTGSARGSYAKEYNDKINSDVRFVDIIYPISNESFKTAMLVGSDLKYTVKGKDAKIEKLSFQNPKRFLKPELCGKENDSLYILTEDQRVFRIRELFYRLNFEEVSNCQTDFLNVTLLGKSKLGLTTDGRLLELTEKSWTPVSGFEKKKFNFLSDSFDILDFFKTDNKL